MVLLKFIVNSVSRRETVWFRKFYTKFSERIQIQGLKNSFKNFPRLGYYPYLLGMTTFSLIGSTANKEQTTKSIRFTIPKMEREKVFEKADHLIENGAYEECQELLDQIEDNTDIEYVWRKARVLHRLGRVANKKEMEVYMRKGFEYITLAMEMDDKNSVIHKWYAILLDAKCDLDGIRSRLSNLHLVKEHFVRSLELNPNDPSNWYILGEFEFGIADMSWIASKIVSTLSSVPSGTYERAHELFLKAEEMEPNFSSRNQLMLGRTYLHFKETEKAKKYLTLAYNAKVKNSDDKLTNEEAEELLKKLEKLEANF